MIRRVDPLVSLPASDPARARAFYRTVLGLEPAYVEEESGFCIFEPGEGATLLGLHRRAGPAPAPDPDGVWIWLQVDDLDAAHARLSAAGVRFLGEKTFLGPGHEWPFLDSEGNVLRLYEPLREVRRSVEIAAPPAAVFAALTDPGAVESWFVGIDDVELEAWPGGRVRFVDPLFGRVEGVIEEFVPGERLRIVFSENWPTHLEVVLVPVPGGTRVEVRQSGFDAIRDRDSQIGPLVERLDAALPRLAARVAGAPAGG